MSNRFHNKFHRHNHHSDPTDRGNKYPDSAYDPIASREFPFKGEFYSEGTITTTQDFSAVGNISVNDAHVRNNLLVGGDLTVSSQFTQLDTMVYCTSAVNINNSGNGPALKIDQKSNQIVLDIVRNGTEPVFYINDIGYTGIGTNSPIEMLTVAGGISGSGIVYDGTHSSLDWNSVYTNVYNMSGRWESAFSTITYTSASLSLLTAIGSFGLDTMYMLLSSGVFTIFSATSAVYISTKLDVVSSGTFGANLSVGGNLSVDGNVSFNNFQAQTIYLGASSLGSIIIPNEKAYDLNINGYEDELSDVEITSLSSAVTPRCYILTNNLNGNRNITFTANSALNVRGESVSLTLKSGDCCNVKCFSNNKASVW